jgi:hypothetical protein
MSDYEKYRYGNPEQPEHGYVTPIDGEPSAYFTPTGRGLSGIPVEYDHGECAIRWTRPRADGWTLRT